MKIVIRLASVVALAAVGAAQITEPPPPCHVDDKPALSGAAWIEAMLAAQQAQAESHSDGGRISFHTIPGGYLAGNPGRELIVGDVRDDALNAFGNTYRMEFDTDGAAYAPFFGSDAPRSYPVHFRVSALRTDAGEIEFARRVAPVRDGRRVSFDRGAFVELYDLAYESVEQSFLVHERVGPGALVIALDVQSELTHGSSADGLVFENELGGVRYSSAIAIDARGERVAAPTRWRDGRIEIEVPAADIERLRFPLLIDPLITTFNLLGGVGVAISSPPDAAFDESGRTWCVVHERLFSATDYVAQVLFVPDADIAGYINYNLVSSNSPIDPRVANNRAAGEFLVVGTVEFPAGQRRIHGERYALTSLPAPSYVGMGVFPISPAGSQAINPDVGGDASLATPGYYCVTWERVVSASDHDIVVQMVRTNSTLFGGPIYLSNSTGTLDIAPSISSSNGTTRALVQGWTIAWQRALSPTDNDVYGGRMRWDGAMVNGPFGIDTSAANARFPSVSSPTDSLGQMKMVAYTRGPVGDADTWGIALDGVIVRDVANLTALSSSEPDENQIYPNIDSDGRSFIVVETESVPGTSLFGVYASTFDFYGSDIMATEGHVSLGAPTVFAPSPRVTCIGANGGELRRSLVTWHDENAGTPLIVRAARYDAGLFSSFCHASQDGVPSCPCGNAPSEIGRGCDNSSQTGGGRLTATGSIDPDTVTLTASGLKPNTICIFAQSHLESTTGVVLGDGLQCVAGTVRRMAVKMASGGVATYPEPGDLSLSARSAALGDTILPGTERYYYAAYRDPNMTWACSSTFNATNALRVNW